MTIQSTVANATDVPEQPAAPKEVFFEVVTLDGVKYRKGEPAPYGTVTTTAGNNVPVAVESYELDGDWIDLELSGGYTLSLPEARVAHIISRAA